MTTYGPRQVALSLQPVGLSAWFPDSVRIMNPRMVNVDRQTPMLLPPDLREVGAAGRHGAFRDRGGGISMKLWTLAFNRSGSGGAATRPWVGRASHRRA